MGCKCPIRQGYKDSLHLHPWTSFASKCQTWAYEHSTEYSYRGHMVISERNKSFRNSDPVYCLVKALNPDRSQGRIYAVYVRLTRRFSVKYSILHTQRAKSPGPIRLEVSASGVGDWECGTAWLQRLGLATSYDAQQAAKDKDERPIPYILENAPGLVEDGSRTVTLDRPFPFMRLASELRLKIFEFATHGTRRVKNKKITLSISKPCQSCKSRRVQAVGQLAVDQRYMLLNRCIYDEVRRQCYSTSTFHFSDHAALRTFLRQISPNNMRLLRKLLFDIGVAFVLHWETEPRSLNSHGRDQVSKCLSTFADVSRALSTYLCKQIHLNLQQRTIDARCENYFTDHWHPYWFGWPSSRNDLHDKVHSKAISRARLLEEIAEEFGRRLGEKMPDCTVKVRAR